jgi:hypothetical protein
MKQDNSFIATFYSLDNKGIRTLISENGSKFQRITSASDVSIGDECFIGKILNDPFTKNKRYKMAPFKIQEWITHDGYPMGIAKIWMGEGRQLFFRLSDPVNQWVVP